MIVTWNLHCFSNLTKTVVIFQDIACAQFLYMCVFSEGMWWPWMRGATSPCQIDLNPYHSPQQQHKTPQFCPVWLGSAETCKPWGGLFAFCVSMLQGKLQTMRRLDPLAWNRHLVKVHSIWRISFIISNWCNITKILIILYIQVLSTDWSCIKRTRCSVIIFLLKVLLFFGQKCSFSDILASTNALFIRPHCPYVRW